MSLISGEERFSPLINTFNTMEISFSNNEIIAYTEMCAREGCSLQRGMNFRLSKTHSVILMSLRKNAPYNDAIINNGLTLIYEGHDIAKVKSIENPKIYDQPERLPSGRLTQNGLFYQAAKRYQAGKQAAEAVRVYEKIMPGVWAYNGIFNLINSWKEKDDRRFVFKFELVISSIAGENSTQDLPESMSRRVIPSTVKLQVWRRDQGKCVICGATTDLHFDHILPYSKGGTSLSSNNVQLLCARHNIMKSNKIE